VRLREKRVKEILEWYVRVAVVRMVDESEVVGRERRFGYEVEDETSFWTFQ
jgi:hypothetical protein